MINLRNAKRFCCDDIKKIENFLQAATDTSITWDIHHRLEEETPKSKLIEDDMYYGRPASELIFLTPQEHHLLHATFWYWHNNMAGKHHSKKSKRKISRTRKARILSGDIVVDTSACHTPEANAKISEKAKERYKDPAKHPMFGKRGRSWYNNGEQNRLFKTGEEPVGWSKGRLPLRQCV